MKEVLITGISVSRNPTTITLDFAETLKEIGYLKFNVENSELYNWYENFDSFNEEVKKAFAANIVAFNTSWLNAPPNSEESAIDEIEYGLKAAKNIKMSNRVRRKYLQKIEDSTNSEEQLYDIARKLLLLSNWASNELYWMQDLIHYWDRDENSQFPVTVDSILNCSDWTKSRQNMKNYWGVKFNVIPHNFKG